MALIFQQEINDIYLNLVLLLEENPFFRFKSLFGIYIDSSYSLVRHETLFFDKMALG